jgi:hypothetical protein
MRKKVFSFASVVLFFLIFAGMSVPVRAITAMPPLEQRLLSLEEKMEAQGKEFSWLKKFKPMADLRLRHEVLFRGDKNTTSRVFDRTRERIRFRIGGEYFFTKNLKAGFRLATGGDDPVSTNQTLDNTFSTKDIRFDRGYVDFKYNILQLKGGKFGVPFMKSELLWDGDLSLEGAAEKISFKTGGTKLELIFGQFVVEEFGPSATKSNKDDPYLVAYQGVVSQNLSGFGKAKVGIGFFDYQGLAGNVSTQATKGNTVDGAGNLVTHYDIFDVLGEFKTEMIMGIPIKVFAEYARNVSGRADNLENKAWQIGTKVGKSVKRFGDWQAKYIYREVERDAVFDAVSDSDFHEGGTNAKGSELGLKVGLYDGILFNASYFITEAITGPKDDLNRLQLDLVFNFF